MRTRLFAALLSVILSVSASSAETPLGTAFTYHGRLTYAGSPASGLHDLRFRLYDADAGGTQVGTTVCSDDVSVTDGLFTVLLDFGAQFAGQERYLEIEVRADTGLDCTNQTGFVVLSPRQALNATPNALFALNADKLDGLDSAAFLQGVPNPLSLQGANGVMGTIKGENTSSVGGSMGLFGHESAATGFTYGVYGQSNSTSGRGVFGQTTAATGENFGGYFQSASTAGRGVYGLATAATGGTIGVLGESASTFGNGVYGVATDATGLTYGGYFESLSTSGVGVFGQNTAGSGTTYGVAGQSFSTAGRGVAGTAYATSGTTYGVWGQSQSTSGRGVFGEATANTGTTYGVHGMVNSAAGYAGYFEGRGYFSGNVGIGTSAPEAILHVQGGSAGVVTAVAGSTLALERNGSNYLSILSPDATERGLIFGEPGSNVAGGILYNSGSTPDGLQFRANGNITRMVIAAAGDVGIGTTAPASRLHVDGTSDATPASGGVLTVGPTNGLNIVIDQNEIMARNNGATASLTLNADGGIVVLGGPSGGNVGIGTTAPAAKLDVRGNISTTGTITIPTTTRFLSLSPYAFHPTRDTVQFQTVFVSGALFVDALTNGQNVEFAVAVNLPHGAVVTRFAATVFDDDTVGGITVELSSNFMDDGTGLAMASVASGGVNAPGRTTLVDTTFSSATVSNDDSAYWVRANWQEPITAGLDIRLGSVRIDYTVTSPLP